jgi:hypothetical protein
VIGGVEAWTAAGLPVEPTSADPAMLPPDPKRL